MLEDTNRVKNEPEKKKQKRGLKKEGCNLTTKMQVSMLSQGKSTRQIPSGNKWLNMALM